MNTIQIGDRVIGADHPPFIIAELSGNHNQSLERALQIVDAAAAAGAHALKLQTYTADTMTLNMDEGEFRISDPHSPWANRTLYELYDEAHTPWEWHQPIMQRCAEQGLLCFSTPFDASAIEFLEALNVPAYKIASFEIIDLPLLRHIAQTGKPVIMSSGMATPTELAEAVETLRQGGCTELVVLKCTSSYPSLPLNSNLRTLPHLRDLYQCLVGLSDHTLGIGVGVAAIALGATVIEKHFTLCRADGGVDSAFSLEPAEMKALVDETLAAWQALGVIRYGADESEQGSRAYRRSLYITEDVPAGAPLTRQNLRSIRPGSGLSPKYLEQFLGKRVNADVCKGTPLSWDLIG